MIIRCNSAYPRAPASVIGPSSLRACRWFAITSTIFNDNSGGASKVEILSNHSATVESSCATQGTATRISRTVKCRRISAQLPFPFSCCDIKSAHHHGSGYQSCATQHRPCGHPILRRLPYPCFDGLLG